MSNSLKNFLIGFLGCLFLVAVIIIILLATNVIETTDQNTLSPGKFKLMIIGDQGQYEYFKSSYDIAYSQNISTSEKINLIFKDTTYTTTDGTCKIQTPSTLLDLTDFNNKASRDQGLLNFDQLISTDNFQRKSNESTGVVFLGDIVYPESKRLSVYDDALKRAAIELPEKWNQRLDCAWNIFTQHLKRVSLFNDGKINEKVSIITGNHSYDVSFNKEESIVQGINNRNKNEAYYEWDSANNKAVETSADNPTNYSYIKKETVTMNGGKKITFVDLNTPPLSCLDAFKTEEEYANSQGCTFDKWYVERWSYTKTRNYYLTFYDIVSNLDPSHWNVIRGHHPPTNFEDGDATFYWDVTIDGKVYNLMNKFEERNVRIFLGSHIHAQAVMTVPFRKTPIRSRGDKVSVEKDGAYCNRNNLKASSEELMDVKNLCTESIFEVDLNKEKLLMVFINGNSGRYFDPISNGLRSAHGNIVWARANTINISGVNKNAFGFGFGEFSENRFIFEFNEMVNRDSKIDSEAVSTFFVKFDEMKNTLKPTI